MWLKVEGDGDFEPSPGAIVDNTGTGGPSTPDFWTVLELIGYLFTVYEIANFLMEVYEAPPSQQWIPEIHSVEAIVRQETEPGWPPSTPYVDPDNPLLQTASAWLESYFKRDGPNLLTITAGAEIYLQTWDVINNVLSHQSIGTYSVNFHVEVIVGAYEPTPVSLDISSTPCTTGVYIDGGWVGSTNDGCTVTVTSGYHTIRVNDICYVRKQLGPRKWKAYKYAFDYWTISDQGTTRFYSNPITWPILSNGLHLTAHYDLVEVIYPRM
jgi:hypothetical protein